MNADIKVEGFKAFKPYTMKWMNTVVNYVNTASVVIPSRCSYNNEVVTSANLFQEGTKIELSAGYNGNLATRFKGFVARVKSGTPVTLECEGYSYQLRTITDFTKSYINTTVKQILSDLIAPTDIVLSADIPDVPLPKVGFVHASGLEVLEWLTEKCLMTIYFKDEELYAGLEQANDHNEVKLRLGWNTAKDSGLVVNEDRQLADVKIIIESKANDGTKTKTSTQGKEEKVLNTPIQDASAQARIAEQKRKELVGKGYQGKVTAFLEPKVDAGDTIAIDDKQNAYRTGKYFCASVTGSYSPSGGRQNVEVSYLI